MNVKALWLYCYMFSLMSEVLHLRAEGIYYFYALFYSVQSLSDATIVSYVIICGS